MQVTQQVEGERECHLLKALPGFLFSSLSTPGFPQCKAAAMAPGFRQIYMSGLKHFPKAGARLVACHRSVLKKREGRPCAHSCAAPRPPAGCLFLLPLLASAVVATLAAAGGRPGSGSSGPRSGRPSAKQVQNSGSVDRLPAPPLGPFHMSGFRGCLDLSAHLLPPLQVGRERIPAPPPRQAGRWSRSCVDLTLCRAGGAGGCCRWPSRVGRWPWSLGSSEAAAGATEAVLGGLVLLGSRGPGAMEGRPGPALTALPSRGFAIVSAGVWAARRLAGLSRDSAGRCSPGSSPRGVPHPQIHVCLIVNILCETGGKSESGEGFAYFISTITISVHENWLNYINGMFLFQSCMQLVHLAGCNLF